MRRVFFSFHYARDCWSVSQVRNSWLANPFHAAQPFYDRAAWEQVKRKGDVAIKSWIDSQIRGTSVTAVLIGPQTLNRKWVQYEVDESLRLGKGLLGITLENMKQSNGIIDSWNRYSTYGPLSGRDTSYPIYSWTSSSGRKNLPAWVESAARVAGRSTSTKNWI